MCLFSMSTADLLLVDFRVIHLLLAMDLYYKTEPGFIKATLTLASRRYSIPECGSSTSFSQYVMPLTKKKTHKKPTKHTRNKGFIV